MRTPGSPEELEQRRRLAVPRLTEGYSVEEVAAFLDVSPRTVWRWRALFRGQGPEGLRARPGQGRSPKLTTTQETIVRRWLRDNPREHGFATARGSAPRLVPLIEQEFGISFNPPWLSAWLRDRGFTPQKPARIPRKRDPAAIAAWLKTEWPRLKKNAATRGLDCLDR